MTPTTIRREAWLVEAFINDPDSETRRRVTVICQSYDGTPHGAAQWAADVFDWCEVQIDAIHRVRGDLIESREHGRLDEPTPADEA